jgi:hypothetical protein
MLSKLRTGVDVILQNSPRHSVMATWSDDCNYKPCERIFVGSAIQSLAPPLSPPDLIDHFYTRRIYCEAISRILDDKEHQNNCFNFIILEIASKPFIVIFIKVV